MDLSKEQRLAMKFCFKAGKSATETLQMLNAALQKTTSTKASRNCMTVQICVYS